MIETILVIVAISAIGVGYVMLAHGSALTDLRKKWDELFHRGAADPLSPPTDPPVQPTAPATVLQDAYIDRDDLMKALGSGFAFAITLDGAIVHNGFGPPLAYYTQPSGNVTRQRPPEAVAAGPVGLVR